MANSLLDFVMSLVRDPEAAAQYAADPAQAIAAAHLTDVTSADVNQSIPVVAESLSSAVPTTGADAFGDPFGAAAGSDVANVWTSGAAAQAFEAFDAFDAQVPHTVIDDPHGVITELAGTGPSDALPVPDVLPADLPSVVDELPSAVIDDAQVFETGADPDWLGELGTDHAVDHGPTHDDPGFDQLI